MEILIFFLGAVIAFECNKKTEEADITRFVVSFVIIFLTCLFAVALVG